MDKPTNYEPSASATRPQDQAIHSVDRQIVETPLELYNRGLGLNSKRRDLNGRQILLNAELLEIYRRQQALNAEQLKLSSEQLELAKRNNVRMAMEVISLASARTSAFTVVDPPTDDSAMPTKLPSPCPPITALPSLLVAALPAARPTAAQERKRPAPTNESTELLMAPKRHRGSGQITNDGSATGSSLTTCHSLNEQVAIERLVAALDIPALVAPATGAPAFGDAPAVGILDRDISALVAPAISVSAVDISDLFTPAAGSTTFGVAPAAGILDRDISAYFASATGATTFGVAPAIGATMFGIAPVAGVLDRDISAYFAPATGATTFGIAPAIGTTTLGIAPVAPAAGVTTFGVAPAAGILDCDISALIAPAADYSAFAAPAVGTLATDISTYFGPAADATTFGIAPATGATMFGNAPAVSVSDLDISALVAPAAGVTTFGNAPTIGFSAVDFSDLVAPATGATTFGVAPAAGILDCDISALIAPAADYSAFATPAVGTLATDISTYFGPAADATTFGVAPAAGILDRDMHVGNSGTAAELAYPFSDVSGRRVTSERLLVVIGEAPFVSLRYVQEAYRYIYGCDLMAHTLPPQERIATLASVVALEHWVPQLDEENFENTADLSILCRRDLELGALRQNYREQLGLADDPNAAVLGPRLCYVLVRMCSMSVDLLTGPMLRSMFLGATGRDLQSISIVTEKRVQRMGANSICHMVESWVGNLCKFITEDFSMDGARSAATQCNAAYTTRCGSASDSTRVALDMLGNNECDSRLFLGNQAADLEESSKRLLFVASGNTSPLTKVGLEQLAMPLRVQNDSS
ncbi:hypothetical protein GGI13_005766 [Coemansia sp. RSA 455]|nr:hypothetical protein GGI13_005766 [Coemansia sp. RSA 455]